MPATSRATAALLGATALFVWSPAAQAAPDGREGFEAEATPSTVAAGGEVTLSARGCKGRTLVHSGIFDTAVIEAGEGRTTARIDEDARKGAEYTATFRCERGQTRMVKITVAGGVSGGGDEGGGGGHQPQPPAQHGVDAGVGGSFGGLDLEQLGLGGLLVAGVLGAAYHRTRRGTPSG